MSFNKLRAVATLTLAAISSFAYSQSTGVYYLGGSIGRAHTVFNASDYSFASQNPPGLIEMQDRNTTGAKIFAGYEFNKNWAAEGAYTNFGKPAFNATATGGFGTFIDKPESWSLAGKGTIPIGEQFGMFAKLGATYNRLSVSYVGSGILAGSLAGWKHRGDVYAGVGLQYNPAVKWGLRIEYEDYGQFGNSLNTGKIKSNMWSGGLLYKF